MQELISKLKKEIIEQLNLQDLSPSDIDENAPLFVEGLGLDSIDSLELIVLLQRNYGLKIAKAEEGREVFHSIKSMAEFILKNQNK
jgi:acyl carrier protein